MMEGVLRIVLWFYAQGLRAHYASNKQINIIKQTISRDGIYISEADGEKTQKSVIDGAFL